jgi:hypothetical protein
MSFSLAGDDDLPGAKWRRSFKHRVPARLHFSSSSLLHKAHGLHEGRLASASASITTELIISHIKAEERLMREKPMKVQILELVVDT